MINEQKKEIFTDAEVVFAYTSEQANEDGILFNLGKIATSGVNHHRIMLTTA